MKKSCFLSIMLLLLFGLTQPTIPMEKFTPFLDINEYRVTLTNRNQSLIWRIESPNTEIFLDIYTIPISAKNLRIQKIKGFDSYQIDYTCFSAFFFALNESEYKPKKVSILLESSDNMPHFLGRFLFQTYDFKVSNVQIMPHKCFTIPQSLTSDPVMMRYIVIMEANIDEICRCLPYR